MIRLSYRKGVSAVFKREGITSFSEIKLRVSGMRVTEVYEIVCRDTDAELSLYFLRYENHEDNYNLQKRVTVPAEDVIALLNDCGVIKWDGFSGKNPPHMLDGKMFGFTATVNGGRPLCASGSNNFPRHYRDFTDALYQMLNETE